MKIVLPPSSALNFLSGVFAGAGINMLTSVSTGPSGGLSTSKIALDSALWVISAATLTWAAQVTDHGERDADLYIDSSFTEREKLDIREDFRQRAFRRAFAPLALTLAALFGAVLLLPGLVSWSRLWQ